MCALGMAEEYFVYIRPRCGSVMRRMVSCGPAFAKKTEAHRGFCFVVGDCERLPGKTRLHVVRHLQGSVGREEN